MGIALIRITLPFPISVNALYSGKGRRFKSKRYQRWIVKARSALWDQYFKPIAEEIPLQITYILGRPDKRIRDAANYIKAVDDLLVSQEVIPDDKWIHRGIFEWGKSTGVTIEIIPLSEAHIVHSERPKEIKF